MEQREVQHFAHIPEKRYFSTFDALRFFAFIKVFLFHLPLTASSTFVFLKNGGGIGVFFFFVLSGFLITYILLEEKDRTGNIQLSNFFIRRILRIWPLYYLMIGLAAATPFILNILDIKTSDEGYIPNWFMSVFFLENYKIMIEEMYPNVSPLGLMWSLCVEEHFYIIWGILLYLIPFKKIPVVIVTSILVSLIARVVYVNLNLWPLDILTNLIYFAFGAIPAYLLIRYKQRFEELVHAIPLSYKWIWIVVTIVYTFIAPNSSDAIKAMDPLLFSILFCGLVAIIAPMNNAIRIQDSNILSRLGRYTYGMYLFHGIVNKILVQLFSMLSLSKDTVAGMLLFSGSALLITITLSILSFVCIEKQFLKLKRYFMA